jgi:hypothetical protein
MAQDDVTNPAPLRGGRQRANHIQVHRIELGLKEREYAEAFAGVATAKTAAYGAAAIGGAAALGLAAYGLWLFLDTVYEIGDKAADYVRDVMPGTDPFDYDRPITEWPGTWKWMKRIVSGG